MVIFTEILGSEKISHYLTLDPKAGFKGWKFLLRIPWWVRIEVFVIQSYVIVLVREKVEFHVSLSQTQHVY